MTDYEESQSSITSNDLDIVKKDIINELTTHITNSNKTLKKDIKTETHTIIELQREMNEREKAIEELLIVRKNTKNVYYIGLLTGIAGIVMGMFNNVMYALAGLGIAITAIVGIYDAKKNKW